MRDDTDPYSERGEVVRAKGHTGEFIVLRVDKRAGIADLGLIGADSVENHMPFSSLQLIREDFSQTTARAVRETTEKN